MSRPRRLLIVTQRVDEEDALLGFFHRWIEEFARHLESVEVICLYKGKHAFRSEFSSRNFQFSNLQSRDVPGASAHQQRSRVFVHSLGKERGYSRLRKLLRFFGLAWRLASRVDGVFVHMNAVWVVLGWPVFALFRKRVVFWIAHYRMSLLANLAGLLASKVVTSTPYGARLKTATALVVGQGIDTDFFCRLSDVRRDHTRLLVLGRISAMKRVDLIIRAFALVHRRFPGIGLDIVGDPVSLQDRPYLDALRELARQLGVEGCLQFLGSVPHRETRAWYNSHGLLLNATRTGSFDKVALEAMACELPALVSNKPFAEYFSGRLREFLLFREGDADDLAEKLSRLLSLSVAEREDLGREARAMVVRQHGIEQLAERVLAVWERR